MCHLSHITWKRVFGIFDQVRFKPAWSATEPSQNLETLDTASKYIILSKQRTAKVLIRLRGCTGWTASLMFAYGIKHVFAWPGPFDLFCRKICSCHLHAGRKLGYYTLCSTSSNLVFNQNNKFQAGTVNWILYITVPGDDFKTSYGLPSDISWKIFYCWNYFVIEAIKIINTASFCEYLHIL